MDSPAVNNEGHQQPRKLSELSEAELLKREFSASDPESLEGVVESVPVGEEPDVEFYYDMAPRGLKVRCVYCGYPNHYVGIVVRYASGARNLVGRDCAKTHHGVDFERRLIDFDAAVDRQSYARRKIALIAAGRRIAAGFAELRDHAAVGHHDLVLKEMRERLPDLAAALAEVARRDGKLVVDRVVRDEEGERARRAQLGDRFEEVRQEIKSSGIEWRLFKNEQRDLGFLGGVLFFASGVRVGKRLQEIETAMQAVTRGVAERDDLRAGQYRAAFAKLNDQRLALEHEFDRLDALKVAFEPSNLARIAQWGNEQATEQVRRAAEQEHRRVPPHTLRFHAKGAGIADTHSHRPVSLSEHYFVPDRSLIELIKSATAVEHEPARLAGEIAQRPETAMT